MACGRHSCRRRRGEGRICRDMAAVEAPWLSDRRVTIIVNPAAHNGLKPKQREEMEAWLGEHEWSVEWLETGAAGDATSHAGRVAESGKPLLLVGGGDGTLNEVVNGVAGSETTVGVVPCGTVNLWARE